MVLLAAEKELKRKVFSCRHMQERASSTYVHSEMGGVFLLPHPIPNH